MLHFPCHIRGNARDKNCLWAKAGNGCDAATVKYRGNLRGDVPGK